MVNPVGNRKDLLPATVYEHVAEDEAADGRAPIATAAQVSVERNN
jgi:hypothetical protein